MELDPRAVWNRVCAAPPTDGLAGDRHLWAVVDLFTAISADGTESTVEQRTAVEIEQAATAHDYFGLPHLGAWIRRLPERAFVTEYSVLLREYMSMIVVDDHEVLWEALERKLAERPDDFKRTG
ncbi:hypothetical protein ACPPVO_54130 [Dactylosporangium sp. McL0621]|uniref:hypothetical protein n=1 Tax=Dactylosporangium sp. McL0621 TaxID=3415678 RepID=UPI003CEE2686